MAPTSIDLRALAESRRWKWRQSSEAPAGNRDPWLYELPCRLGVVYPWGGDLLCLHVEEHGPTRNRLRAIPGVESYQRGDVEEVFRFNVDHLDSVAELVEPRKRRVEVAPSPAQIAARLAFTEQNRAKTTRESTRGKIPGGTTSDEPIVDSGAREPHRR